MMLFPKYSIIGRRGRLLDGSLLVSWCTELFHDQLPGGLHETTTVNSLLQVAAFIGGMWFSDIVL